MTKLSEKEFSKFVFFMQMEVLYLGGIVPEHEEKEEFVLCLKQHYS